jgi:hypothetical protein
LIIGDKDGQMPISSKKHKIQMFDGQVTCVACGTTVGYFPHKFKINGESIRQGLSLVVLDSVEYVTPIDQTEFTGE